MFPYEDPLPEEVLGVDEFARRVDRVQVDAVAVGNSSANRAVGRRVRRRTEAHGVQFEPEAQELFETLLPRYLATRVYAALLESSASESAARRRAMKAATDNADDLIKALTLQANRARQAQITQNQ